MYESIFNSLKQLDDYLSWESKLKNVFGYLEDVEGYALKLLAEKGPGYGEIVEIGSFMGRSTCWLAAGISQKQNAERVNAIDHFAGSIEHQKGHTCECKELLDEGTTFNSFLKNLKSAGLDKFVNPIIGSSAEAAKNWSKPIRLLFIDGDHSFEESENDFNLWFPHVINGGIVVFHDIGVWPGVTRFYRQIAQQTNLFQTIMNIATMQVTIKL